MSGALIREGVTDPTPADGGLINWQIAGQTL